MVVYFSVAQIDPLHEPHLRKEDAFEHSIDPGKFLLVFMMHVLLVSPALVFVYLGDLNQWKGYQNREWIKI